MLRMKSLGLTMKINAILYISFLFHKIGVQVLTRIYFYLQADAQGNSLRKQQRENDDLQEQLENLQVQLNHAQNRYVSEKHIIDIGRCGMSANEKTLHRSNNL